MLAVADQTVTAVVLPSITQDLGIGVAQASLSITVFMIAAAAMLALGGQCADRIGRRRTLALALAAFSLSSLLTGMADSLGWLLLGRAFHGVVFAALAPATLGLIHAQFPEGNSRTLAVSLWTTATASAVALGPLIGGLFADLATWRDAFFVNIPLCLIAATGVLVFFRKDIVAPEPLQLDFPGIALLAIGVGAVVFACQEGTDLGWWTLASTTSPDVAGLSLVPWFFAIGAAGLVLLGFVERRRSRRGQPVLLRPDLLAINSFRLASFSSGAMSMAIYGLTILLPIWIQFVLDASAIEAGVTLSSLGVGMAMGGLSGSVLLDRYGRKRVALLALGSQMVLLAAIALVASQTGNPFFLMPLLLPYGVAYGLAYASLMNQLLSEVPSTLAARAGGIAPTLRLGLDALATAIMVGLKIGITAGDVTPRLAEVPSLTPAQTQAIEGAIHFRSGSGAAAEEIRKTLAGMAQAPATAPLIGDLKYALTTATWIGILAALGFVLIGFILALRLPATRRTAGEKTHAPQETLTALFHALDHGDFVAAGNLLAQDFVHTSTRHPDPMDAECWLAPYEALHQAFPDIDHGLHDLESSGETVTGAFRLRGTHLGTLDLPAAGSHEVPATGRAFQLPVEPFTATLREGRVVSIHVAMPDQGGLGEALKQLGIESCKPTTS